MPVAKAKTTTDNPMKALRARLAKAGVNRTFLDRVVLPTWWEDSNASTPGGFREVAGYVSAHLGYSLASLLDDRQPLTFVHQAGVKFKKAKGMTTADVSVAAHLSIGVARSVASACMEQPAPVPLPEPEEWRRSLLATSDKPWVTLANILRAAWQAGIPVIPLKRLPVGAKKPDALTTMIGERPVIVVLNGRKSPSWISFIVAHELGHIQRGHLKPGHTLVDEKIVTQAADAEEGEANTYALKLLTGFGNLSLGSTRSLAAVQLAQEAVVFGKNYRVAPGVAALNYGFTTGLWPLAIGAVGILERHEDAGTNLQRALEEHLNRESLTDDAREWIERTTGVAG